MFHRRTFRNCMFTINSLELLLPASHLHIAGHIVCHLEGFQTYCMHFAVWHAASRVAQVYQTKSSILGLQSKAALAAYMLQHNLPIATAIYKPSKRSMHCTPSTAQACMQKDNCGACMQHAFLRQLGHQQSKCRGTMRPHTDIQPQLQGVISVITTIIH